MIVTDLPVEINLEALLKLSGYTEKRPAPKRLVDAAQKMIDRGRALSRPRAVYEVYEVADEQGGKIKLGGGTFTGKILHTVLAGSELAAAYAATLGDELDAESRRLGSEGDVLSSVLLDTVGSLILANASVSFVGRLYDTEARPRGYAVTAPFGPGQCKWDLTEQRVLFDLIKPESIGIALSDSCLMIPKKSVSGVLGFGPKERIFTSTPCRLCSRKDCPGRNMFEVMGVLA